MRRTACLLLLGALHSSAQTPAKHRVLFNRFRVPEIGLFVADASGKNEHALPHRESEYSPTLTPDGKWIVFTSERSGQSDIYRMHPDGSGLEQLTDDPAFDDQGALSPDGKSLAFISTRGEGFANLWLLDIASHKYTNLTTSRSGNFRPSWSPDGRWIAFSSDRDANPGRFPGQWEHLQSTGIYLIHPDGTGLRRLTKAGGVAGSPSWSSDAKRVLYYETDETGAYLAKSGNSRTEFVARGHRHRRTHAVHRIQRGEAVAAVVARRQDQLRRARNEQCRPADLVSRPQDRDHRSRSHPASELVRRRKSGGVRANPATGRHRTSGPHREPRSAIRAAA